MAELPEVVESLKARLDALEKRVGTLERSAGVSAEPFMPSPVQAVKVPVPESSTAESVGAGFFAIFGKAMLGIAGAYALRAVAESGSIPRLIVALVAIGYALAWLAGAAKAIDSRKLAGTVYACTSAVILAPMLWELTLRFSVLRPFAAALVLVFFILAAIWLTWNRDRAPVLWIALSTASLTALALQIATHENLPYIAILLGMLILCETLSARQRTAVIRLLVALAADLSVWMLIYIYSNPETARQDYAALGTLTLIAPAFLLFLVEAAVLSRKSLWQNQRLSIFDFMQAVIAFLLTLMGLHLFEQRAGTFVIGVVCIALSIGCYVALLHRFRNQADSRNFNIFAIWSAALLLLGLFTALSPTWAATLLALSAIAAIASGARLQCLALELHGVLYLTVAVIASGQMQYAVDMLTAESAPRATWAVLFISACAVIAYIAGRERQGEAWKSQALHFISAWWASLAVSALLAHGLLEVVGLFVTPLSFHVALIRTFALCVMALGLAYAGYRGQLTEMRRIAYTALALVAVKLVLEDLRHGRMAFIAASFFLFAVTLIAVPHIGRKSHTT